MLPLTYENKASLDKLFDISTAIPDFAVAAALGDRILGFLVADCLNDKGVKDIGTQIHRYVSNAVLHAFLTIAYDVRCRQNHHSYGDHFEALLAHSYVVHGHDLEQPRKVIKTLMEFVDGMVKPEWNPSDGDDDSVDVAFLLTEQATLLFEKSPQELQEIQKALEEAKLKAMADSIYVPGPATTVPGLGNVTTAAGHVYPAVTTTWVTRTNGTLSVTWFPCCGRLAVQKGEQYFGEPCTTLVDVADCHTGVVKNTRTSRNQARNASPPAIWACCGKVAVSAEGAPFMYHLNPSPRCSRQLKRTWPEEEEEF